MTKCSCEVWIKYLRAWGFDGIQVNKAKYKGLWIGPCTQLFNLSLILKLWHENGLNKFSRKLVKTSIFAGYMQILMLDLSLDMQVQLITVHNVHLKTWGSTGWKLVMGMRGHNDPFFQLTLTHWPPFLDSLTLNDPPFLIIHNQFSTKSHPMTPYFDSISKFSILIQNFCPKCVQICILLQKLAKICLILTIWSPFSGLLTEWPPFRRRISHWKTPAFE